MAKFLLQATYTSEGLKGLLKDGGSKRKAAVEELCRSIEARLESFYFAFGEPDVYIVVEAQDNASAIAASLVTASTGMVHIKTTVLIPPDEMDRAISKNVRYTPPGH